MQDPLKYFYICFGLFLIKVDCDSIDNIIIYRDWKVVPLYFRWSGGFELNSAESRCATDQSTEDPDNLYLEIKPETKDDIFFPRAFLNNDRRSQRYLCDSNSSIFQYNPQTRRLRHVSNGHCVVVHRMAHHYRAISLYPTMRILKSINCQNEIPQNSIHDVIWGSEFRLVRDRQTGKPLIRFISPEDGHEWPISIHGNILIVANEFQRMVRRLKEPIVEIVDNYQL